MNQELLVVLKRLVDALEKGVTVTVKLDGLPAVEQLTFTAAPRIDQASGQVDVAAPAVESAPVVESAAAPVVEAPKAAPVVVAMRPLEKVAPSGNGLTERKQAISRRRSVLASAGVEIPEHLLVDPTTVEDAEQIMSGLRSLSVVPAAGG